MSRMLRTVAVIQARTGSSRLPGKVLEDIRGRPLVEWTLRSVSAVPGMAATVLATTTGADDDDLAALVERLGFPVHRGPVDDVLTRVWDAVAPYGPDIVLRQTADNPFPDPMVAGAQLDWLIADQADYVGIAGWPLGIAAEVCRVEALEAAVNEATDPGEREHVMPFIYSRPERFRASRLPRLADGPSGAELWRYTVDTAEDLTVARSLGDLVGHGPPVSLEELEGIMARHPQIAELNATVEQRSWRVARPATRDGQRKETG